jgi:hypothetical protein
MHARMLSKNVVMLISIMNYNITGLYKYKTENEMLQAKCKQLEALLNASKQKAKARISKGKAQLLRINEDEKKRIDGLVTSELWRTCKFINCKDDKEKASEFIYNLIYAQQSTNNDKMFSWTATYKGPTSRKLFTPGATILLPKNQVGSK